MAKYKLHQFRLQNLEEISLYYNNKIFEPNLTTGLLINACNRIIKKNNNVLDLGCGCGIISHYLYQKKKINEIYSSDISKESVDCSIINAEFLKAKYEIRYSNLLNNWKNNKFDIIINDISGISTNISNLTKWFKFAPNDSGKDGINFTIKILKVYKKYLNKNGSLIFPIIGLSNKTKIIKFMKKNLIKYKLLDSKIWPLPKSLHKHEKLLSQLKAKKIIDYEKKFNILTTKTEIFVCK
jgi:release factor glutamine methyltransferase